MNKGVACLGVVLVSLLVITAGCSKNERTVGGVGMGAVAGTAIGAATGGTGGAIIGGLGGGALGGILGRSTASGNNNCSKSKRKNDCHKKQAKRDCSGAQCAKRGKNDYKSIK